MKKIGTSYFDKLKKTFGVYKNSKGKQFFKDRSGKFISLPKNTKVISLEKDKGAKQSRGREVSVKQTAGNAQFIYGRMRVGGTYTFQDTSQDSKAYLVSGEGDKAILFTARTAGSSGNSIAIQITSIGTNPTLTVTVPVSNLIVIALESSSGTPLSTREEVLQAVRDHTGANSLVTVNRTSADGNGIVQSMLQTNLNYGGGTSLYHFITYAFHEIDAVENFWIDDNQINFGASPDPRWAVGSYSDRVFLTTQLGKSDQEAQTDLKAQLPSKWTDDHRQRGWAGSFIITNFDANVFANGNTEPEFLVRGKKCYDPRTGLTVWTQNAALIIADYMMDTRFGMKLPLSKIDLDTLIDAADCCDEDVTLAAGGTQKRYTINGVFDTSMTNGQVLSQMSLAIAGSIVYQGGKWFINPGKWRAPTLHITEDDFRSSIRIATKSSKRDSFNGVKGLFIDPSSNYEEKEFPLVKNDTYISDDGSANYQDVNLTLVQDSARAQRIAKIFLERNRQPIELAASMSARLLQLVVSDTVTIEFDKYGWEAKPFEVADLTPRYDPDQGFGCEIVLKETDEDIYSDSMSEVTYDIAPNTSLPSATDVEPITDLTLSSGTSELLAYKSGSVLSRLKVSWTGSSNIFVYSGGGYEIEFKKSSSSTWLRGDDIPGSQNSIHILDVEDGIDYDVRVRPFNILGVRGEWVTSLNHTIIGKSEKPANVQGFESQINNLGILLNWTRNTEPDIRGYRIKRGTSLDWWSATIVENLITATSLEDNFRVVGSWYYMIKAVDTSGNESTDYSYQLVNIEAPQAVSSLKTKATNNLVLIDWEPPASTSFPVAKYKLYKGASFETATYIGEAFLTFTTYTEPFAGSSTYWVTAVDTGGNEGPEVGVNTTWYDPPNTVNYTYNAIDVDGSELSSAIFDESYSNSFFAPVQTGDSFAQHFSRNGWDCFLDQMVGYDSDAIKAIPGISFWLSANAEVTVDSVNAISQISDLKNSNNATQGTAANRPILSRADNKENRLPYCADLSNASGWSDNNTTRPSARIFYETTANSTHRIGSLFFPLFTQGTFICEVVARPKGSARWFRPVCEGQSGAYVAQAWFDCTGAGAIDTSSNATDISITALTGSLAGYYRCKFTFSPTAANAASSFLRIQAGGTGASPSTSYIGVVTDGWEFEEISIRSSLADDVYLATTTFPYYRGINGNRVAVCDGSNDFVSPTLVAAPSGGIWAVTAIKSSSIIGAQTIIGAFQAGANARLLFNINTSGAVEVYVCNGTSAYIARKSANSAIVAGTTTILAFTYDGGTSNSSIKIYKNGTQIDTTDIGSGVYTVPGSNTLALRIGYDHDSARPFKGYIAEVIYGQGSTLSDPNRAIIEGYLAKFTTGDYAPLEPFIGDSPGFIDQFTDNSWSTIQDKINAGNTIWIEPSDTETATFFRTINIGSLLASSRIEVNFTQTTLDGSCTVETFISTSADLITWTDHPEGKQVLAYSVQYVKVEIRINGSDQQSLVRIGDPTITVGVRKKTLSGRASTNVLGEASVSIGSEWLSIEVIQLTQIGGTGKEVYPDYKYTTLNPTAFDVLGFSAGAPAAVDFNWTIEGTIGEV